MNLSTQLKRGMIKLWPQQLYQVVRATETNIQIGFALALVLLIIMGVMTYQATRKLREADKRGSQIAAALAKLEAVSSLLSDAEDVQRGFVITGDERYLGSYQSEVQTINHDLDDLGKLTAEYPEQLQQIGSLKPLVAARLDQIVATIKVRREQGFEPALQMILAEEDKPVMDDIEALIGSLRGEQEQSLYQRAAEADAREQDIIVRITFGSIVAIMLVAGATVLIDRDIRARKQAENNLRKSRDQLAIILEGVADGIAVRDANDLPIYANAAAAQALGFPNVQDLLEAPAAGVLQKLEILDEHNQPIPDSHLPERLALRGEQHPETILHFRMHTTGEERWMVVKATPSFDEGKRVQYVISIFHDITERVQAYHMLEQRVDERTHEIERRRQVAEGLRDILTILNSNQPLDEILHSIVTQACRLLGTDAGAVYRLGEQHEPPELQAASGLAYTTAQHIPAGWGALSQVFQTHQPVAIADLAAVPEPELPAGHDHLQQRFRAVLAVPLMVKEEAYGALTLYYTQPREFSHDEIEMAVTFSDQAALAIENARLRIQAERVAVAAERNRLARDLHDAVTQTLFSTSLIADVLPRLWERNADEARRQLEELRLLTRSALSEMRALLLELRPATMAEIDLGELLRLLTEVMAGRARIPVTLMVEGQCQIPHVVRITLYRIAQEALNNVVRHSGAQHLAVALFCRPDQVEMRFSDDGRGFDPSRVAREHLGLDIMRERAEDIGATLSIETHLGGGTQVTVVWSQPPAGTNQLPGNKLARADVDQYVVGGWYD